MAKCKALTESAVKGLTKTHSDACCENRTETVYNYMLPHFVYVTIHECGCVMRSVVSVCLSVLHVL